MKEEHIRGKIEDENYLDRCIDRAIANCRNWRVFQNNISHGIIGAKKLPLIGNFAGRVLLAILVYVVASKIIHKLCKLIVASMKRANADTGVTQFVSSFAKAAMYFFLIVSIATSFGVKESSIAALLDLVVLLLVLLCREGYPNLAGGVIILILRPFVIGDYIIENSGNSGRNRCKN